MSTLLVGWEHVDKNDVAFILLNKRGYLLRVHNTLALWEEQGEVRAYKPSTGGCDRKIASSKSA